MTNDIHNNPSNLNKLLEVFDSIEERYPGLLQKEGDFVYFTDRSISNRHLYTSSSLKEMDRLVCISLFGMGFCLSLFFDSGLMVTGFSDIFQMDGDQGLPLGACMSLYKYDIKIAYHGIKSQKEPIVYDRQAIERQYTINNIIHEQ